LYRQFFEAKNSLVRLPFELTASPTNPLIDDVKSVYLLIDPTNYISEESRNTIYSSTSYFKTFYVKEFVKFLNSQLYQVPFNLQFVDKYVLFYFFGTDSQKIGKNDDLYKNPYRPLRKGVSSMLRLHATGAIAMPVEIRLQILASSRDVIHS
jgi:hypothetical protein